MSGPNSKTFWSRLTETTSRLYRALLGRGADEPAAPVRVDADLALARAPRRALAQPLLEAFAVEPLAADDARFVGREEQLERWRSIAASRRAGSTAMVAVTGPQGCGISSFLKRLAAVTIAEEACRYSPLTRRPRDAGEALALLGAAVGCDQPIAAAEALIQHLNAQPPGMIALDDGHCLAARGIGAGDAFRVVAKVMLATRQRHLWMLGCEEVAWRRLTYVHRAERLFGQRVELRYFTQAELGQCLAARLAAAGIAPPAAADGEETEPFFAPHLSTLHKASNGKPDLAFHYFLNALVDDEAGRPALQEVTALDFGTLKNLISEELFTLAEVAAHGRLSLDEHRSLFRSSREGSGLLLERLYHQGLLERGGPAERSEYRLTPLYADVITRHLIGANYLY